MRFLKLYLTLALLALAAAILPAPALARSPLWSAPETATPSGPSYGPRIAYDQEGFAHVVYFAGPTDSEWEIYYTNNRSGAWSPPRMISDGGQASQRNPDIAIGRDGHIHVVYEKRPAQSVSDIYYAESPDLGVTWSAAVDISQTPPRTRAYEPAAAVDANNTLHVVWIDSRWADVLQTTYARRPAGGSFSAPIKVSGNTFDTGPDITTSGSGGSVQVHIVYAGRRSLSTSTSDYDIWYVGGAGGSFAATRNLSNDPGIWSLTPTITSDGAGNLFLAWDTEGSYHDIAFARSNSGGAAWTPALDLTPRGSPALNPVLAYGLLGGAPTVHLVWTEGATGQVTVYYLGYDPASNSFGAAEQASETGVFEAWVAGSPNTNQAAVAYRARSGRVSVSYKGASNNIAATLQLQSGLAATRDTTLQAALSNLSGDPVQMRYALDRPPDARDPWQALSTSFSVVAPPSSICQRRLYIQLRTAVGRVSPIISSAIVVDSAVQASVAIAGIPSSDGGDPAYSHERRFALDLNGSGECVGLSYMYVEGPAPFLVDDNRFAAELPLPGPTAEGPRRVTVRLEDSLGNTQTYSSVITFDRTPPAIISGTLSVDAPAGGLASLGAGLTISGLQASDNLYPGGYWGAIAASSADPSLADEALAWRPVSITRQGASVQLSGWSLVQNRGLPAGTSLAGQPIEVRVRLLDGAGNPSTQTLTATVRLAPQFRLFDAYIPTFVR